MSRAKVEKLMEFLRESRVYCTVDTYLALVFQTGLLKPEQVAGVFPWATEEPCRFEPEITPYTDAICRNVALYYWQLSNHQMTDWSGNRRAFCYRASNTLSFRAKAPYHNIERGLRALIKPAVAGRVTLQFDWSAAEFTLILQKLGYKPPADAYAEFTAPGLERDPVKKTTLAWIYGASMDTLVERAGGDTKAVDGTLGRLREVYPLVHDWREQCMANRRAEFHGFVYDLGDIEYKRPNHWAQTALQLCKWELLSRLTLCGVYQLGCGDLHDQLFFDVDPAAEREKVVEVVKQVRAPLFGAYNLPAQFKAPAVAWG